VSEDSLNLVGAPRRLKSKMKSRTMTPGAYEIPSWAIAILFWSKVLAVKSKGIPGTRGPQHDNDLATETEVKHSASHEQG
jgi:hypothetical protein